MRIDEWVRCEGFPCQGLDQAAYRVPPVTLDAGAVRMVLIGEAPPTDPVEGLYAGPGALHAQTTLEAFRDAGLAAGSVEDLLARGIYLTTAIKCGKQGYAVPTLAMQACSHLLERELALFPRVGAYLLMGDVAIRAFNEIARRTMGKRVIPAGSTYKLRGAMYRYGAARVYPSYLQAGKAFYIEKSKRAMIAEDLASALAWIEGGLEKGGA